MSNKGMELLQKLEEHLSELYGSPEGDVVPEAWAKFPLCYDGYGDDRDGCLRESGIFWDDDVMQGIKDMFYQYYARVQKAIEEELGTTIRDGDYLATYVEPSYEDVTSVLMVQESTNKLLLLEGNKPWNFVFETPEAMADDLQSAYERAMNVIKGGNHEQG